MKILALETATDPGSVALWVDGVIYGAACPEGASNSATLLPVADALLRSQGFGFADLDGVAFGAGPGSFTGLRVACGVAQGLAVARELPLLGVGTLEAMAEAAGGERVMVALDARRAGLHLLQAGETFVQRRRIQSGGGWQLAASGSGGRDSWRRC